MKAKLIFLKKNRLIFLSLGIIVICISILIIGSLCGVILLKNNSTAGFSKELKEDIHSIKTKGKIINAKEKEPFSVPPTYYGKGYYIFVPVTREGENICSSYIIYSSDNHKEIWHYKKCSKFQFD